MPIVFYPHDEDLDSGTIEARLEVLLEAAERYKAFILDAKPTTPVENGSKKRITPRDITASFSWGEIAKVLREIRELPETNQGAKLTKAKHLTKLSEIYEVLRGAKMSKLEAVRLALVNEANQLRTSASQVA